MGHSCSRLTQQAEPRRSVFAWLRRDRQARGAFPTASAGWLPALHDRSKLLSSRPRGTQMPVASWQASSSFVRPYPKPISCRINVLESATTRKGNDVLYDLAARSDYALSRRFQINAEQDHQRPRRPILCSCADPSGGATVLGV